MDCHFYCPPVTLGGKRIIQRQSLADSACQWCQFMTSCLETPQSHKSRRTNRHLIRFQGVPSHCAIHSSLHIELNSGFVGTPLPIFLFLLPSKKINRSYFPASTLKTCKNDRGGVCVWGGGAGGRPRSPMLIHFICFKLTAIGCSHSLILRCSGITLIFSQAAAQNA